LNRRTRWGFSPRAAQKNPNAYRGLVVKVAGYSAYFTDLGRSIQEYIIGRYEFGSAL
jgi:formate C-acetyltransferase